MRAFNALSKNVNTIAIAPDIVIEENDNGMVMHILGFLGAASKGAVHAAVTTNALYGKAADAVLNQATGTFAKLFASFPAK
ncbi:MAG: hypothetical protein V4463_17520 [Pseudomonadota bacterium]